MRSVARHLVPNIRRVPRIHLPVRSRQVPRSLASKKPRAQHSVILDFDYRIVFENNSYLMCCKQITRVGATKSLGIEDYHWKGAAVQIVAIISPESIGGVSRVCRSIALQRPRHRAGRRESVRNHRAVRSRIYQGFFFLKEMPNIQRQRDAEIMKASAIPETALHNPIPVRTQFSHNICYISAVDIDVNTNWLYMSKLKTRPFHPVDVAVDLTGWYIVFANSTQGSENVHLKRHHPWD